MAAQELLVLEATGFGGSNMSTPRESSDHRVNAGSRSRSVPDRRHRSLNASIHEVFDEELVAIVRRIREKGMRPSLFTNGIKATRDLLQELVGVRLVGGPQRPGELRSEDDADEHGEGDDHHHDRNASAGHVLLRNLALKKREGRRPFWIAARRPALWR